MKKLSVIIACIAVTVAMLAGCSQDASSNEAKEQLCGAETPEQSEKSLMEDIAYHLELSAMGREYRDMDSARRDTLLGEYRELTEGYDLLARESIDGASAYILGVYDGEAVDSPLNGMYCISTDGRGETQLLYREADLAVLELAVEHCDYRFNDPGAIRDAIREARLDCGWLDEPLYAAQAALPRLREILRNARQSYVTADDYDAKLSLHFVGGEKLTLFKGTGSDTVVFWLLRRVLSWQGGESGILGHVWSGCR